MASGRLAVRVKQLLKTVRNPPLYVTASLVVALGGLLNGLVFISYHRPLCSFQINHHLTQYWKRNLYQNFCFDQFICLPLRLRCREAKRNFTIFSIIEAMA